MVESQRELVTHGPKPTTSVVCLGWCTSTSGLTGSQRQLENVPIVLMEGAIPISPQLQQAQNEILFSGDLMYQFIKTEWLRNPD